VADAVAPGDGYRLFTPDRTWRGVRAVVQRPVETALRMRVYGADRVPRSGGAVLASNHASAADPVVLGVATPRTIRYMAKAELFTYNRALSVVLRHAGVFAVHRGESDMEALRLARSVLRAGHLLGVFAEGTRQHADEIGDVKPGAALLAVSEGVPLVPAVIHGTLGLSQHPSRPVTVVFGEPLTFPVAAGGRTRRAAVERATAALADELARLQRFARSAERAGRPRRALPPSAGDAA
jgi:1-acyl-sn-glycerol-3-phosphate acyltransferase